MTVADASLLRAALVAHELERARMARELHEDVGQALKAIILGLDRLALAGDRLAGAERQRLKTVAAQSLEAVRRMALEIWPSTLGELGLAAALRALAREAEEGGGPPVSVQVTLPERREGLPGGQAGGVGEVEMAIYRVAQEALANVVEHAQARAASVVVSGTSEKWTVVVEDDGVGFDPEVLPESAGLGLAYMRARLVALGGDLRVESSKGGGTSVYGRVPGR